MSADDLQVIISIAALGYSLVRGMQVLSRGWGAARGLRIDDVIASVDPQQEEPWRRGVAAEVSVRRLRKNSAELERLLKWLALKRRPRPEEDAPGP